ncbi:hypothetical protein MetexDRAFT_1650 [Methylorubrum extorquens DSM 13060]|uniref:Uncharacterized protein n=2 Tax=Methylorubrum extorquens TaxID=408 RepID=H1KG88_METEX|nr:hypothetical protein MetexDRAFT_1650 [Methylorubrum extorquens DSM 13060]
MPKFLVSYDLRSTDPDPHGEFLDQVESAGWTVWKLAPNGLYYHLPNTTLTGVFRDIDTARSAFQSAWGKTKSKGYKVIVEKWIIVEYNAATYNSDDRED